MELTPPPIHWNTLPKSVFRTRRAKRIWRPMPQAMTRSLMACLWVENNHAMPRITARPRNPVNLPMLSDDFQDEFALVRLLSGDAEGILHHIGGFFYAILACVVDAAQHAARVHLLAGLDLEDDAHSGVDLIFLAVAARADHVAGDADILGVDSGYVSAARRGNFTHARGVWQQLELVQGLRIAALCLHRLLELFVSGAIDQVFLGRAPRFIQRRNLLPKEDHAGGEFEGKFGEVRWTRILERLRRLHDFERVADGVAERLVHVRDQRLDLLIHAPADADHRLRQASRVDLFLHECAATDFDIQHQRVDTLRQFLRHDRRGDERDRLDGGGDVAQGVEFAVGGSEMVALADEGEPDLGELIAKFVDGEIGAEARNRFEFVQRAAGVAERASGHHGHHDTGRGCQRSDDEAGFVAHAAGGMLVDFDSGNRGEIHAIARAQHAFGEAADLAVGHPREESGHQKRRHLVVGDFTTGVPVHQKTDLFRGEFLAIAFPLNQVNCTHYE